MHLFKPYILYTLLFLSINFNLIQAQNYKFKHLTVEDGLSHRSVNCAFQDSKGFLWFGTWEGLNKYDGYKFTVYRHDPEAPNSISDNGINDINEDSTGLIWIATNNGLNYYDRSTDKFTVYKHDTLDNKSVIANYTRKVDFDSKGR